MKSGLLSERSSLPLCTPAATLRPSRCNASFRAAPLPLMVATTTSRLGPRQGHRPSATREPAHAEEVVSLVWSSGAQGSGYMTSGIASVMGSPSRATTRLATARRAVHRGRCASNSGAVDGSPAPRFRAASGIGWPLHRRRHERRSAQALSAGTGSGPRQCLPDTAPSRAIRPEG